MIREVVQHEEQRHADEQERRMEILRGLRKLDTDIAEFTFGERTVSVDFLIGTERPLAQLVRNLRWLADSIERL